MQSLLLLVATTKADQPHRRRHHHHRSQPLGNIMASSYQRHHHHHLHRRQQYHTAYPTTYNRVVRQHHLLPQTMHSSFKNCQIEHRCCYKGRVVGIMWLRTTSNDVVMAAIFPPDPDCLLWIKRRRRHHLAHVSGSIQNVVQS